MPGETARFPDAMHQPGQPTAQGVVSSTFQIVQILVQSYFELVSSILALEATEPVSEPVTQMAVELINNHIISVQQKR